MAAKSKSAAKTLTNYDKISWFDRLTDSRKNWFCIGIMAAIILILFWNILFHGMIFAVSGDAAAFSAWKQAMEHIRASEHREDVFWIPQIFTGMPIFGTLLLPKDVNYIEKFLLRLPIEFLFSNNGEVRDIIHIFLAGLFMFLLCRSLQCSHLVSLLAALVLMLNPYAIGALEAHQGSKLHALSVIPVLFLLTNKIYAGLNENRIFHWKNLIMFGLIAAVTGWMMLSLHIQIIFYGLFLLGSFLLYQFITSIRKEPLKSLKIIIVIGCAIFIGLVISAYVNLPTLEYSHYSIRGSTGGEQSGLNYDYATSWSFHPFELMNYIIPSFFGFASPFYWGWMPFTESTLYIGVVPIILSIIALIYKRNRLTWFLLIFSVIMFLISFGRHFGILYNLMFDYFPYFNKFRVPVLILHLIPITVGVLAAVGLTALREVVNDTKKFHVNKLTKGLVIALIIIGSIFVIGLVAQDTLYSSLSGIMFQRGDDVTQFRLERYGAQASRALDQVKRMRFDLLWNDYIKFSIISALSIALIIGYLKRKYSFTLLSAGLIVILMVDLIIIDSKFINPKPNTTMIEQFQPDATKSYLMSDKSTYRIYPLGRDFQDNIWMYHNIESVGGYSPAKLRIYQEMLDSLGLYPPRLPLNMNLLSLLNVKYIISPGQIPDVSMSIVNADQQNQIVTYLNPNALPRAFFVDTVQIEKSKSAIFNVLRSQDWNPAKTAVLGELPAQLVMKSDSTSVQIVKNWSQEIIIKTFCTKQSLLVLSDAYYPAGWKAYIDEMETEIYQTNYVVRSVVVPPGNHTVKYSFSPTSTYAMGYMVSQFGYLVAVFFIVTGILRSPWWKDKFNKKTAVEQTTAQK
jgi:hypothetical protein